MGGGRHWEGSWGQADIPTMSGVVRFAGSTTADDGRKGWGHEYLNQWRNSVPGPIAAAAQLPVAMGASAVGRPESCVPLPLLLLGSLKLRALSVSC